MQLRNYKHHRQQNHTYTARAGSVRLTIAYSRPRGFPIVCWEKVFPEAHEFQEKRLLHFLRYAQFLALIMSPIEMWPARVMPTCSGDLSAAGPNDDDHDSDDEEKFPPGSSACVIHACKDHGGMQTIVPHSISIRSVRMKVFNPITRSLRSPWIENSNLKWI